MKIDQNEWEAMGALLDGRITPEEFEGSARTPTTEDRLKSAQVRWNAADLKEYLPAVQETGSRDALFLVNAEVIGLLTSPRWFIQIEEAFAATFAECRLANAAELLLFAQKGWNSRDTVLALGKGATWVTDHHERRALSLFNLRGTRRCGAWRDDGAAMDVMVLGSAAIL